MISWFYKVINDSEQERSRDFWKSCESMEKTQKDAAIKEHMDIEWPYKSPHIMARTFKSAMKKIEEDLKENMLTLSESDRENLYLHIDSNYLWCSWQLDISIEGLEDCKDDLRISLQYDADPNGELEEEDIDEINEEIEQETENFASGRGCRC